MFIQTLLLQAPHLPLHFSILLIETLDCWCKTLVRTNLLSWWNFTYPALFTSAILWYTCIVGKCSFLLCNKQWYSRHVNVNKRDCSSIPLCNPIIQIKPWHSLKGSKWKLMFKALDRVIHMSVSWICLSLPVRPIPSCGFEAQRDAHQNQSPSTGNVSGSCHRGFSNSSSVTSSFMKTSRSGL